MSGGVDSSVAAALLKEQGFDVIGVYILGWTGTPEFPCSWQQEEADARLVAEQLDIPFQTVNLSKEYEQAVIETFFEGYRHGATPNPDILCNREIKFKALWAAVRQFEPDYLATGHYARVNDGMIVKGVDENKDQSYFLWGIDRQMLPRILFPVGDKTKSEIRQLASSLGLPTAHKKDSQGICFVGPLKVREFLRSYLGPKPGQAMLADGRPVGQHQGANLYTIGQRLGAGSVSWTGDVPPLFVIAKDVKRNLLVVGPDKETLADTFVAVNPNWLSALPKNDFACQAKVRYRQADIGVTVRWSGQKLIVKTDEPIRAITPGQSIVFYRGDQLLGGAVIETVPAQQLLLEKIYATTQSATSSASL